MSERKRETKSIFKAQQACSAILTVALFSLTACNSGGDTQALSKSSDSVTDGSTPAPVNPAPVVPTPAPTATVRPSPTPSPSSTATPDQLYTGPADVAKYVNKFVDDAKKQGVDVLPDMKGPMLSIQIASLDQYGTSVIGLCETSGNLRRVTFDPDFWNSVSETQRELLAHHELGHCVLYRPHRSDKLDTGAYASIMYPIIMSSSTYTNNLDYYQDELFTNAAMAPMEVDPDKVTTHICDLTELTGLAAPSAGVAASH